MGRTDQVKKCDPPVSRISLEESNRSLTCEDSVDRPKIDEAQVLPRGSRMVTAILAASGASTADLARGLRVVTDC